MNEIVNTEQHPTYWCRTYRGAFLWIMGGITALLFLIGFSSRESMVLAACFALIILIIELARDQRAWGITLHPDGCLIQPTQEFIYYESIQGLQFNQKAVSCSSSFVPKTPLSILHDLGRVDFPGTFGPEHSDVYRAILSRIPDQGIAQVPTLFNDFYQRESQRHRPEQIMVFQGRMYYPPRARILVAWIIGLFISGIFCFVANSVFKKNARDETLIAFGSIFLVISAVLFLIWLLRFAKTTELLPGAMIITPSGIALKLNTLQGEMTWGQVLNVQFKPLVGQKAGSMSVHLQVAGAFVSIPDSWNRPLPIIERIIQDYYQQSRGIQFSAI